MNLRPFTYMILAAWFLAGCARQGDDGRKTSARTVGPANPRVLPVRMAGHILAIPAHAALGDLDGVKAHQFAMRRQIQRAMRIPDNARRIDPEAARVAVAPLPGVRGVVWIDRSNLIVMVDGGHYRSMRMMDRVCRALTPLGDTLAVVVNLQNVNAVDAAGADTLSRNCRLPAGQRAFAQKRRQIDVLDPGLRQVFEAQQAAPTRR